MPKGIPPPLPSSEPRNPMIALPAHSTTQFQKRNWTGFEKPK